MQARLQALFASLFSLKYFAGILDDAIVPDKR